MTGMADVGGGMRGIFSAGVYDCMLDSGFMPDYCIGVSAGSANMTSLISRQRGRLLRFYTKYAMRKQYMSMDNFLRKGSYIDLDYIYSTLSNSDGEDPLDFDAILESDTDFHIVATRAQDGKPEYFGKDSLIKDDLSVIKASCCLPVFCKAININGVDYYDGGVSDPVPFEKAFEDGCDKVIVVLTKPVDFRKTRERFLPVIRAAMRKYPSIYNGISSRHELYNTSVEKAIEYEKQGKIIIIAPENCYGVDTLTRETEALEKLYQEGYECTKKCLDRL